MPVIPTKDQNLFQLGGRSDFRPPSPVDVRGLKKTGDLLVDRAIQLDATAAEEQGITDQTKLGPDALSQYTGSGFPGGAMALAYDNAAKFTMAYQKEDQLQQKVSDLMLDQDTNNYRNPGAFEEGMKEYEEQFFSGLTGEQRVRLGFQFRKAMTEGRAAMAHKGNERKFNTDQAAFLTDIDQFAIDTGNLMRADGLTQQQNPDGSSSLVYSPTAQAALARTEARLQTGLQVGYLSPEQYASKMAKAKNAELNGVAFWYYDHADTFEDKQKILQDINDPTTELGILLKPLEQNDRDSIRSNIGQQFTLDSHAQDTAMATLAQDLKTADAALDRGDTASVNVDDLFARIDAMPTTAEQKTKNKAFITWKYQTAKDLNISRLGKLTDWHGQIDQLYKDYLATDATAEGGEVRLRAFTKWQMNSAAYEDLRKLVNDNPGDALKQIHPELPDPDYNTQAGIDEYHARVKEAWGIPDAPLPKSYLDAASQQYSALTDNGERAAWLAAHAASWGTYAPAIFNQMKLKPEEQFAGEAYALGNGPDAIEVLDSAAAWDNNQKLVKANVKDFETMFRKDSRGASTVYGRDSALRTKLETVWNQIFAQEYATTGNQTFAAKRAWEVIQHQYAMADLDGSTMWMPPDAKLAKMQKAVQQFHEHFSQMGGVLDPNSGISLADAATKKYYFRSVPGGVVVFYDEGATKPVLVETPTGQGNLIIRYDGTVSDLSGTSHTSMTPPAPGGTVRSPTIQSPTGVAVKPGDPWSGPAMEWKPQTVKVKGRTIYSPDAYGRLVPHTGPEEERPMNAGETMDALGAAFGRSGQQVDPFARQLYPADFDLQIQNALSAIGQVVKNGELPAGVIEYLAAGVPGFEKLNQEYIVRALTKAWADPKTRAGTPTPYGKRLSPLAQLAETLKQVAATTPFSSPPGTVPGIGHGPGPQAAPTPAPAAPETPDTQEPWQQTPPEPTRPGVQPEAPQEPEAPQAAPSAPQLDSDLRSLLAQRLATAKTEEERAAITLEIQQLQSARHPEQAPADPLLGPQSMLEGYNADDSLVGNSAGDLLVPPEKPELGGKGGSKPGSVATKGGGTYTPTTPAGPAPTPTTGSGASGMDWWTPAMAAAHKRKTVRGLKNNNPGNIDRSPSNHWVGEVKSSDSRFAAFSDVNYGLRAMGKLLLTYFRKYGLNTMTKIIMKYAPPADKNNSAAYAKTVADKVGLGSNDVLDLTNVDTLQKVMSAMIGVECYEDPFPKEMTMLAAQRALGLVATPKPGTQNA